MIIGKKLYLHLVAEDIHITIIGVLIIFNCRNDERVNLVKDIAKGSYIINKNNNM